jgi:hypothetical protein
VATFCEHGTEPAGIVHSEDLAEELLDSQKGCAQWIYLLI